MSNYTTRNKSYNRVNDGIQATTIQSEANTLGVKMSSSRRGVDGRMGKDGTELELIVPVDANYSRGVRLELNGRQARVLYTALERHFSQV